MFFVCLNASGSAQLINHWSYVFSHFSPEGVYVYGFGDDFSSKYHHFQKAIKIDTLEDLPNLPLVLLSPKHARYIPGQIDLKDFEHPKECIYVFGPDNVHFSEDNLGKRSIDHSVYISTDSNHDMYAFVSYAITLYDRIKKNG